jgi:small subunit ribosomal protein S2
MPQIPSLLEMLKAGVHFGHQSSKWHPKMRQYIFGVRHGIHIVDLEQTARELERALFFVREVAARGGTVMFVSLKEQANEVVREAAQRTNMPYIVERWLGGVFTNWGVISKLIQRLDKLETERDSGAWNHYTKKEQLELQKDMERLQESVGGIRNLTRVPDVLFMVGVREGKNALREAKKVNVPVVALIDTDTNPELVDYIIPGNDDALRSIQLMVQAVSDAIEDGKEKYQDSPAPLPVQVHSEESAGSVMAE